MAQWHLVVLASLQKHSHCYSGLNLQVHMDLCVLYSSTFTPLPLRELSTFGALLGDVNR